MTVVFKLALHNWQICSQSEQIESDENKSYDHAGNLKMKAEILYREITVQKYVGYRSDLQGDNC